MPNIIMDIEIICYPGKAYSGSALQLLSGKCHGICCGVFNTSKSTSHRFFVQKVKIKLDVITDKQIVSDKDFELAQRVFKIYTSLLKILI